MRIALTIAGSDSGGGAGIQADLKTFQQFGVFGTSAITAVTAQNTVAVIAWEPVSPTLLRAQIDALATDLRPDAVKTGMMGTTALIQVVADAIRHYELTPCVVDPVMVATSGDALLDRDGVSAILDQLVPLASLLTPNIVEASALTGITISDEPAMRVAAKRLVALGAKAVLVKGGHLRADDDAPVVDQLYDGEFTSFTHPRLRTKAMHGTGCTLSAAIVAQLAIGVPLRDAVRLAIDYVHAAITTAPALGSGNGPLNHSARGSSVTKALTSD
jgi:hydroxymethylpyrimidine/phosphomethylpyrimidine kinase